MDILTPGDNAGLGRGWLPLETEGAAMFRGVTNDAELYVAVLRKVKHYLTLHLQPGPGVNFQPFELLLKDHEKILARTTVKGRQMISFELPATEPMVRRLLLHVEAGGRPASADTGVCNFRVSTVTFIPGPVDVLPPELAAKLRSGWYPLETFNGETFRWAGEDARIAITEPSSAEVLLLELAPGPGVRSKPFVLRVFNEKGEQISEAEVKTREVVAIPLAGARSLTLRAEGGGNQIGSDTRIMNFRVFQNTAGLRAPAKP